MTEIKEATPEGWRDIASMPNDGRDVWVFGGRFFEPTVMPADGDWWRLPDSIQPPTHWMPFDRPLTAAHARIAELAAKLVGVMDAWEHDQAKAKIALDQRDTAERERDEALDTLKMVREIGLADEDGAATVESVIERVLRTSPSASAVLGGDQTGAIVNLHTYRATQWEEAAAFCAAARDGIDFASTTESTSRLEGAFDMADHLTALFKEMAAAAKRAVLGGDQTGATPSPSEERYRQALERINEAETDCIGMARRIARSALSPTQPEGGE